ncbi:hypothetical protein D3C72_1927440 [compost metagenome]
MLSPAQQQILAVEAAGLDDQLAAPLGVDPALQLALGQGDVDLHRLLAAILFTGEPGAQALGQAAHLLVQIV